MIWFLEGQSSQRDILIGAREALPANVRIFASHRKDRPEITSQADVSFQEPLDNEERIDWVIATALEHGIKVILAGRIGSFYEVARDRFEAAGLQLVTGGMSMDTFDNVDDKAASPQKPSAPGWRAFPP